MANPGVGSKFVSVNLNKSYGKPSSLNGGNGLGGGGGRGRPSGHGGMVVLSRPRSLGSPGQKGPRLAVPPPMNLPSLRKEHEKADPSSSSLVGVAGPGLGSTSSSMGWMKPHPLRNGEGQAGPLPEPGKIASAGLPAGHRLVGSGREDANGRPGVYTPPGARATGVEVAVPPADGLQIVEKAVVLRGEDFPSLQASLPGQSLLRQKLLQKQKTKQNDAASTEQVSEPLDGVSDLSLSLAMRPQMKHRANAGSSGDNGGPDRKSAVLNDVVQTRKDEGVLPSPLPMVRLSHSYDWADDERDTSYRPEHNRDHGFSRSEIHGREREFDAPWPAIPRGSSSNGGFDLYSFHKGSSLNASASDRNVWDTTLLDAGRVAPRDAIKGDTYGRELPGNRNGRDEYLWKGLSVRKDGHSARDAQVDQTVGGHTQPRPPLTSSITRDKIERGRNSLQASTKESAWDGSGLSANVLPVARLKESSTTGSYGQIGQKGSHSTEAVGGRGTEQGSQSKRTDPPNWLRGSTRAAVQNNMTSRSSFSLGTKGFPINDPILSFGKEKRLFAHNGKSYVEDSFMKDVTSSTFDGRDPFAPDIKVVKRKKDVLKAADFYDPIRESFEAELERVQKMQEQERQRVLEEQAKALELARKEEEERERLAREEAERRRKLEEEAREAAWRAEQERLEAAKRAEEQKRAREEEKRQMFLEEERRKEAARQKLLELEARMARRQADPSSNGTLKTASDNCVPISYKEKKHSNAIAAVEWEDSERVVERLTSSASSESSSLNRSSGTASRPQSSKNGYAVGAERTKSAGSWRRDVYNNGSNSSLSAQDSSLNSNAVPGGRSISRREIHGGLELMPDTGLLKGAVPEMQMTDDISQVKGQRWNFALDDHYNRGLDKDVEYIGNSLEKFGDLGYGQSHTCGGMHGPYPERMFQNTDMDGISFGRSRHSVRQPRVLPPPSLSSMNKNSLAINVDRPSSSTSVDAESEQQLLAPHKDAKFFESDYGGSTHQNSDKSDLKSRSLGEPVSMNQNEDKNMLGCDSQSSLSVSSAPNSPTHLSHDDIEDGADSNASHGDYGQIVISENDNAFVSEAAEKAVSAGSASPGSVSPGEEDWIVEENEGSQEQEEYDDVGHAYQEEEEVHEENEGTFALAKDFRDLRLEEQIQNTVLNEPVLDFENSADDGFTKDNDFMEERVEFQQISHDLAPDSRLSEVSLVGEGQNTENNHQPKNVSSSICETEKSLDDLVPQPVSVSNAQVPHAKHSDDRIGSSDSVLSGQQLRTSAATSASSARAAEVAPSAVSSVQGQTEVPVQVQFGLFSGPSLMPSPLPAIQIGSIRMPLHLHPQVGAPLGQLHPSQPPMFQFGQLSYPAPITQGVLPIVPQTVSFVQPTIPSHYSVGQQATVSLHSQPTLESSRKTHSTDKIPDDHLENKQSVATKLVNLRHGNATSENTLSPKLNNMESLGDNPHSHSGNSFFNANSLRSGLLPNAGHRVNKDLVMKKVHRAVINNRESRDQIHREPILSNNFCGERATIINPSLSTVSNDGAGRVVYSDKNSGAALPYPVSESSRVENNGFKRRGQRTIRRTEFRVRENVDRRQTNASGSSANAGQEVSASTVRIFNTSSKSGGRKDVAQKATKLSVRSETSMSSGYTSYRAIDSEGKVGRTVGSETESKRLSSEKGPRSADRNLKRNIGHEEDVHASLQSGVVRVFKQAGIETPSDEDDFIEVRSKRQMLNDRREQREKEIKAKSRAVKGSRKPRSVSKNDARSSNSNKSSQSLVADGGSSSANGLHAEPAIPDGSNLTQKIGDLPLPITSPVVSQHLPPIGTPTLHTDAQADKRSMNPKSLQSNTFSTMSGCGGLVPGLTFENNNAALDDISASLGAWGNLCVNHHVVALTQNQLDEAMKPAGFEARVSPTVDHGSLILEASKGSTSILAQDKSFTASASSLNSLLAGEKIHFGAVTSPTILPPSSCAVLKGGGPGGPPGSCMSDVPIEQKVPATEGDHMRLFDKATHSEESCVQLEDPEAEAEAAASAVAVAAISSDDPVGNGLGAGSASVADTKSYGGDVSALTAGAVASSLPLSSQSRSEESLSVALPADLSVETPSLWPPLPSPQSSSSQMLSHFPGAPHSHFPCFEMNPMLRGPIFTFGPRDETSSGHLQAQKSNASGSGSLGSWQQQCHSGVDSFYGPPAGFTGPFIGPPGPIPGVQGPPHMVVYNHFAPVGQFGQMGLRLMGTTYIPSGKQPDWKHIPASTASLGHNDSSISNLNMVPGQCDPSIPVPIQHLGPGSPLVPIASPLGMFDMSPFQPSADLSVQARWSHIPAPPVHSFPPAGMSMPSQQAEVLPPPQQFNHATAMEPNGRRFDEDRPSKPSEGSKTFSTNDAASQFPDELGLNDASSSGPLPASKPISYGTVNIKVQGNGKILSRTGNFGEGSGIHDSSNSSSAASHGTQSPTSFRPQTTQPQTSSAQQYVNPIGHLEQKGRGGTQKVGSGSEWSRRPGFTGRSHAGGGDKNFTAKMKQIYVAKPASNGTSGL
ncbi:uncharacterized protein LOC116258907 [Nymphaea colorata]|nr:uncharacterized protein LOC116258907 [Nymphaea colorata]